MTGAAIIIPIYRKNISENELLSLTQCFKILNNYPVVFVGPESLDTKFYEEFCNTHNIEFKIERFKDKFFKGLSEYSKLLLNVNFYKKFESYEYILLYQLDAWVFRDELKNWMDKGYDYIGAPWFERFDKAKPDAKLLPIAGNGGLSLRKVSSIIQALSFPYPAKYVMDWGDIFYHYKKKRLIWNILSIPKFLWLKLGLCNLSCFFFKTTNLYEDIVFAKFMPKAGKNLKFAPPEEAMHFSFEVNPSKLYKITNNKLPFGCHAWEKYEPEFWAKFITFAKETALC